ncbi:MAG TPA: peptide deformylase [Bacillota bacterium]
MITMEDIVREGHPALRKTAEKVPVPLVEEDVQLSKEMLTFLKNSQDEELATKYKLRPGVGLAAPQLNINKQIIAIHVEDAKGKLHSYCLFNPKIVSHSVEQTYLPGGEGCLSVDREIKGYVPRYARITVQATDIDGNQLKLRLRDLLAIVVQHEIDHLNGVMFFDRINKENPFFVPDNAKALEG